MWKLSLYLFIVISFSIGCKSCYSFRSTGISEDLKTFYVADFKNTTVNAPPTIQQTFTERLKEKISRESRLIVDNENPDITFSGTVTRFSVASVAPEGNETTAANRLDIAVSVTYENVKREDDRWTQTFSFFLDFPSDRNLLDVQDELITQIFEQIIEDIFNRAFSSW